jgi:hypothetical protein
MVVFPLIVVLVKRDFVRRYRFGSGDYLFLFQVGGVVPLPGALPRLS